MGLGNWTFDITDGVLKNHDISSEMLTASYENTRAMEFVRTTPFGKNRGESATIPRIHAITEPDDATVSELGSIPEDSYTISGRKITVAEYARVLPYTSFAEELLVFDLEVELQDLLRTQLGLVMDTLTISTFKTAKVIYYPETASTGSFDTDGVASTTSGSDLNVFHVEQIVTHLIETLFAEPFDGGDYTALCRYKSLLSIRQDTEWEKWHQYLSPEEKYNGEVGRLERVRFVETNHKKALVDRAGGLGQALFFGKNAVGFAESTTPELRAGIPTDLGRKKVVGWYGAMGWAIKWDTANPREAQIVRVDSDT